MGRCRSVALVAALCAACSSGPPAPRSLSDPSQSVVPVPDYTDDCAPLGADASVTCLRVTLDAIDTARAQEGVGPMELPADFAQLSVPEQLFVALDAERVDRGLAPLPDSPPRSTSTPSGRLTRPCCPPGPAAVLRGEPEWIGAVDNGLDADYQWLYFDGPGSGVPQCSRAQTTGCWEDRRIALDRFASGHLVMGVGYDPAGDTSPGDRGGSSLAATMALTASGTTDTDVYTWKQALASMVTGTLQPLRAIPSSESDTGISDPSTNVDPVPDYTRICAPNGLDTSPKCLGAVLAAVNRAHALEGVRPMVLPPDYGHLCVPDQLFVAVNLERVDRGLAPFVGLTTALDQQRATRCRRRRRPSRPERGLRVGRRRVGRRVLERSRRRLRVDVRRRLRQRQLGLWAARRPGCWGHRKGILDDFGSGANLVMGAALNTTSDTHSGDSGGTSMAVTLAVATAPASVFTYRWSQVVATLPVLGAPA